MRKKEGEEEEKKVGATGIGSSSIGQRYIEAQKYEIENKGHSISQDSNMERLQLERYIPI